MKTDKEMHMTLRLELFVDDLSASRDFYTHILNFTADEAHADGYTPLRQGAVVLSLNLRSHLSDDHPIQAKPGEGVGRGIEIVLEVDDIDTLYAHVQAQDWPISSPLQEQPWRLRDFRLVDPDGYYWRLTSRKTS